MWCSGTNTPSNPASSAAWAASRVSCQRRPMFAASGGSCGRKSRPNFMPASSERGIKMEIYRTKSPSALVKNHLVVVDAGALGDRRALVGDDEAQVGGHQHAVRALRQVPEVGQHVTPPVGLGAQGGPEELHHARAWYQWPHGVTARDVHDERGVLGEARLEQIEVALVIPGPVVAPEVGDLRAVRHPSVLPILAVDDDHEPNVPDDRLVVTRGSGSAPRRRSGS